jgi:hypothetical protein
MVTRVAKCVVKSLVEQAAMFEEQEAMGREARFEEYLTAKRVS